MTSNASFVGELLYSHQAVTPKVLLASWAVVFIYAFLRRDRTLQLMAFWIVIVPLPIAFIFPIRGGASLYLLLFGWAVIFAKVAFDLITLISRFLILVGQAVGVGAPSGAIMQGTTAGRARSAAIGTDAGAAPSKMSSRIFRVVATLLVASALAIFTQWENQRFGTVRALLNGGQKVSHVIEALKSLNLQPAPGSTVLLRAKENPFENKWHALFIASLVWNDRSLQIWLEGVNQITPQQMAKVDYIVSLNELQAKVIRSPEIPQSD